MPTQVGRDVPIIRSVVISAVNMQSFTLVWADKTNDYSACENNFIGCPSIC